MPFIPEWAFGVVIIILAVSIAKRISGRRSLADRLLDGRGSQRGVGQTLQDVQSKLGDLDEVQRRLDDIDDLQRRVGELEERVDFTERLLAQQRDPDRIAPPKRP